VLRPAPRSQQAQQRRLQGADKVEAKELKAKKAAEAERANANAALGNAFNRAGEARAPACCDARCVQQRKAESWWA
jgi:hypothetical protein